MLKKEVILFALVSLMLLPLVSADVIFNDNFEDGVLDEWTTSGSVNQWHIHRNNTASGSSNPTSYEGNYSLFVNATATIEEFARKQISTIGYKNINFSFYAITFGLDPADWFAAYFLNGSTWVEIVRVEDINQYTSYSFNLSSLSNFADNNASLEVRFGCSSLTAIEWCNVDNVTITGDLISELDTTPPIVNLIAPANGTTVTNSLVYFTASFTDNVNVSNTTLNIWNSTSLVGTNFTVLGNLSISANISFTLPRADTYFWNYLAYDNSSNSASNNTNFTITLLPDTTAPDVVIVFPTNTTYSSLPLNFNVSLNENGSVQYTLDGGINNVTMTVNNTGNGFNATNSSIRDGTFTFRAYANDTTGNNNYSRSVVFSVDRTVPLISFVSPTEADGTNVTANAIYANVSVTETNFANITFRLYNKTGVYNVTTYTALIKEINWTGLAFGNYTYNVSIRDLANNFNSTATRNINLSAGDTISPRLTIVYPQNATYNVNVSELNYSVSDANLQVCWYTLNNGMTNVTIICGQNVTGLNASEGANTWRVYANDSSGNVNFSGVTFFVNASATGVQPVVNILYPSYASTYGNNNSISLNFSVISDNLASCWYTLDDGVTNSTLQNCANTSFGFSSNEIYNLTIYANESLEGKVGRDSLIYFVNVNKPTIHLLNPKHQFYSNNSNVNFTYVPSFGNVSYCELWGNFNGTYVLNQTNSVALNQTNSFVSSLAEGNYSWAVACADSLVVGNNYSITGNRTLFIDTTAPNISSTLSSGTTFSQGSVSFSYTVEDTTPTTCVYNITASTTSQVIISGTQRCDNTIVTINVVINQADTYIANFNAKDSSGNNKNSQTSFSVSGGSESGNGGGGGGGGSNELTSYVTGPREIKLEIEDKEISARRGTSEQITLRVVSKDLGFVNDCKLKFQGTIADWFNNDQVKGFSAGERFSYDINVNVPEDAEPAKYNVGVVVECEEGSLSKSIGLTVFVNDFEAEIKDYERVGNNLKIFYNLAEFGGKNHDVTLDYEMVDLDGIKRFTGREKVDLKANENLDKVIEFNLPKDSFGEFNFNMKLSDGVITLVTSKKIFLPSGTGLTGFFISDDNRKALTWSGLILISGALAFFVYRITKNYKKKTKHLGHFDGKRRFIKLKD